MKKREEHESLPLTIETTIPFNVPKLSTPQHILRAPA